MKKCLPLLLLLIVFRSYAQDEIRMDQAKFKTGDNPQWKSARFQDADWHSLKTTTNWEEQGFPQYDGYAWYRFHFRLPSSLRNQAFWKDSLRLLIGKVDDNEETYLNGTLIGKTDGWNISREYRVSTANPLLHWDGDNVLAVRVYDHSGAGGMYSGPVRIRMMDLTDGIQLTTRFDDVHYGTAAGHYALANNLNLSITGQLKVTITDPETGKNIRTTEKTVTLQPQASLIMPVSLDANTRFQLKLQFTESRSHKTVTAQASNPYILTPQPSASPRINSAAVFGVRPNSPVLYKIAATGDKPIRYSADHLPQGLAIDAATGIITGVLRKAGDYKLELHAANTKGSVAKTLTIKVGDLLALTPPMGWNSWNCWGLSVSADKLRSSAQALINKGLIDHGWTFMNIDDGWEQPKRDAAGNVVPNEKFPDMKALGDWLHGHGLKFGIYSSPGPKTCGGYLGSYQYELNDARSYAQWGIDYLKYDWCSYGNIAGKDTTLAAYQKPYKVMRDALLKQNRDIVYSLCQYGMKDVWKWGNDVNGNCWRTTGDINDSWESLSNIGFHQTVQYAYAKPGRWNDPDMLIVGEVGWGDHLHPTRLTPDEQYTHISLWCLLSAPLLIGCDISKMDDFTLSLLTNDEVIALDQDPLGNQAKQVQKAGQYQVWMKSLQDGSHAIGIFNLSDTYQDIHVIWNKIGLSHGGMVRDLWRQKDLGNFASAFDTKVPPHGVRLIRVK